MSEEKPEHGFDVPVRPWRGDVRWTGGHTGQRPGDGVIHNKMVPKALALEKKQ